jgi:hypothetical protein
MEAFIVIVVLFVLWRISLFIWPDKDCPTCKGMGSRRGPLSWKRVCGVCYGSGRVPRIGAKGD